MTDLRFPNESDAYRAARKKLLRAEITLRATVADVAALRRELPAGGMLKEDYIFHMMEGGVQKDIRISELFTPGKNTLFLYSLMYGRKQTNPCSACTSLIDYLHGGVAHHSDRFNFAVCAAAPIVNFKEYAERRGWKNLRLLSSAENTYNRDYFAEDADGNQFPMANIFVKKRDQISHFWGSEMLHSDHEGHPRHMDQMWPLWNILDLTPDGRGESWGPKLSYED